MPSIRSDRPRIWLSPAILADLKIRAVDANPRWLAMKSAAGRTADWSIGLANYALTFALTGDVQYAQKALALLLPSCADGLNAITPDSGYQARNALPAIAYCFDY